MPGSQRAFLRERWSQPGIQGIPDRAIAVDTAKRMNDDLAAPDSPASLLWCSRTCAPLVTSWSAPSRSSASRGAMINGYSNIGDMDTAQYLDEPPVWDFWARVKAVYLHRVFG